MPRRNISPGEGQKGQGNGIASPVPGGPGPVGSFLQNYAGSNPARFHMPGHKGRGRALQSAAARDITEIPGADNLLSPEGILKTAQEEAAAFFGAAATAFLPGGSSQGMQAAILSLPRDAVVFASRDCHRSLISALALSGHAARFLPTVPQRDGRNALPTVAALEAALGGALPGGEAREEGAATSPGGVSAPRPPEAPLALVITRPDYYGRCCDIQAIGDFCRRRDIILVVDEAHGAHFPLSDRLPASSIPYADISFASAHKTLDAPNPAAYLHLGRSRSSHAPTADALERAARLLGSTSPPYPLLAALDQAWRGQETAWGEHIDRLEAWRRSLPPRWRGALERGQFGSTDQANPMAAGDFTRLCFDVRPTASGHALEAHLRSQGVFMEMADRYRVVGITSPLDPPEWYDRLRAGLESYAAAMEAPPARRTAPAMDELPPPPEQIMTVRQALLAPLERVAEDGAAGRICARSVGAYPPGSALVCPGERIDRAMVKHLQSLRAGGATLFGLPFLCVKEEA